MTRKCGGRRIEAAGLILAALVLGLSGLLQRESLAQPAEDLQAQVQDAIADLKDEDPEVRRSAAETLGDIAEEVEDEAALAPAIPPLLEALQDEDTDVVASAASALASVGSHIEEDAIPALIDMLGDESTDLRVYAAWALARIGGRERYEAVLTPALRPLIQTLQDQDPQVRSMAAQALRTMAYGAAREATLMLAIPALIEALQDEDANVRVNAVGALAGIAPKVEDQVALKSLVAPLIEAFEDDDAGVRKIAAAAFGAVASRLRDGAAVKPGIPLLMNLLQDNDAYVRLFAAWGLGKTRQHLEGEAPLSSAIATSIEALGDETADVRRNAALALRGIAPNVQDEAALVPAIPALAEALQDEDTDVRKQAWVALSSIARLVGEAAPERVLAAFTKVLHGEDTTTSIRAAEELASILSEIIVGEPDAMSPDDLCRAYVYLGYIADGQGNRDEAASWYEKVRETRGRRDVAELLLAHGADANARSKSRSIALHWATFEGYRDVARLLLDAGADVNAKSIAALTPLHTAAWRGHRGVARLLLDAGADVRAGGKGGWTPLHTAAWRGHQHVARLLLDAGAVVTARDEDGWTPLHAAAYQGHQHVARLLLDAGAVVRARDEDGWTPLHAAAWRGQRGVARLLLDAGAVVIARDEKGRTPLHTAARAGHQDVARLLLDAGADLRVENDDGWSPLYEAASRGHNELVAMLLDRAADSSGDKPEPPVAVIRAEPTSGNVPLKVQFDGSTDPNDSIVLYSWAFGDGEGAVGPRVAHFYPSEGAFQAELTVADYAGQTDTATIAISGTTRPDKIAVVVDSDLGPLIQTRLDRYVADLEASGCAVEVREWMTGMENEPALLKQYLMSVPDITGAVFIGAIAPAYYEYDEDFEGYARFPCDLYYMDFTAEWSDSDGDSFFDTIDGEPYPAIWVSRLYAANLEDVFPGLSRADLINRYLDKNHDFRTGALRLRDRALAYHDDVRRTWTDSSMSLAYSTVDVVNDTETTSAADMMTYWDDNYEYAWLTAHSSPKSHAFSSREMRAGVISQSDVAAGDPQVLFWNLHSCLAARFVSPTNCIGNCYVFAPTYGLSLVGSAKPGAMEYDHDQFFAPIAQGHSVGEALRRWFATHCEPILRYKLCGYGMTLLGDGSLRIGRFMDGNEALQDDDRNLPIGEE